jgi:flagellar motor switch protein FliN/FliY
MEPESVDDLLSKLQTDADAVAGEVGAPAEAGVQQAAETIAEIAGEMAPPPNARPPRPLAPLPADDFFAPPTAMPEPIAAPPAEVNRLLAIEVPVIVQLGMRKMNVGEVMRLAVGAIVEFHKPSDEELDLLANNKPIGKGHAVKVGENFGIKITSVGTVKDTIRKLGGI